MLRTHDCQGMRIISGGTFAVVIIRPNSYRLLLRTITSIQAALIHTHAFKHETQSLKACELGQDFENCELSNDAFCMGNQFSIGIDTYTLITKALTFSLYIYTAYLNILLN